MRDTGTRRHPKLLGVAYPQFSASASVPAALVRYMSGPPRGPPQELMYM